MTLVRIIASAKIVAGQQTSAPVRATWYLGSMGGDDANVGDVVTLLQRGNRVDVKYDSRDGGVRFEDAIAKVVGDITDLHALLNVGSAFDQRVPDAGAIGDDVSDSVEPHRIFNGMRVARQHLERPHGAERTFDQQSDVVALHRSGVTSFHHNRRFAASCRGIVEVAGSVKVSWAIAPDDDVIESEG